MNSIKIANLYAINDEELEKALNELCSPRIISVRNIGGDFFTVIYEVEK